jgi:hypothetical protein
MGTKISVEELYERDNGMCGICGNRVTRRQLLRGLANRDHIVPASLGGTNHQSNLRLAHYTCNIRRGNDLPNNGDPTHAEKREFAFRRQNGRCGLCDLPVENEKSISALHHLLLCHKTCIREIYAK